MCPGQPEDRSGAAPRTPQGGCPSLRDAQKVPSAPIRTGPPGRTSGTAPLSLTPWNVRRRVSGVGGARRRKRRCTARGLLPPARGPGRAFPDLGARLPAVRGRRGSPAVPPRRGPRPPGSAGLRRHGRRPRRAGDRGPRSSPRRRGRPCARVRRRAGGEAGRPRPADLLAHRAAARDHRAALRQRVAGQRARGRRRGRPGPGAAAGPRPRRRNRTSRGARHRGGRPVAAELVVAAGRRQARTGSAAGPRARTGSTPNTGGGRLSRSAPRARRGGPCRDRAPPGPRLGLRRGHARPGPRRRRRLRARRGRAAALRDTHRLPGGTRDGTGTGRLVRHHRACGARRVRAARGPRGDPARGTARAGRERRPPPLALATTDPAAYVRALAGAGQAAELTAPGGLGDFGWLLQPVGFPDRFPDSPDAVLRDALLVDVPDHEEQ